MTRLRTATWALAVTQVDGVTPLDLSGKTLWFFAKNYLTDSDAAAVIRKNSGGVGGITITNAALGLATLEIDPADTSGVLLKTIFSLICEFVLIDGANRYELDSGKITIQGNISVPT